MTTSIIICYQNIFLPSNRPSLQVVRDKRVSQKVANYPLISSYPVFGMRYLSTMFLMYSLLLLITSCDTVQKKDSVSNGKEIVLRLKPTPDNPRNSEGDFIQLKNKQILFVYTKFTGGAGDHAQAHLVSRVSSDKGKTWSNEDLLVVSNEGEMNVMSVSLLRLNDGRIALFYLRKNSTLSCIPYMRISADEAKTWSDPIRCINEEGYHVLNNDRVIQLKKGRLILPVALHGSTKKGITSKATICCYYSDDNGESWQKSQAVYNPENITLQEPGVVELKNEKIMMFCRTDKGVQYISYSKDRGENWTTIKPGNIISPRSPASIKRIPKTGDLILVWNNNLLTPEDQKRTPFNLAVSKDDGKTWDKIKAIESDPDGWYCYTAINFIDNHVLLGHCAGNRTVSNGLETTQITRLSLDWIYDEAIPDPYIKSDKNGTIELACDEQNVQIRYSVDGKVPDENANLYTQPFQVKKPVLLQMQAYKQGKPESGIVTKYIGTDILQKSSETEQELSQGLKFKYFEGEISSSSEIEKLPFKKDGIAEKVNLEKANSEENFALVFDGFIKIPENGKYTLHLNSNDGSVLYLNKELFIDNDGQHGNYEVSVPVSLQAGLHSIQVKYFQTGGGKTLKLSWEGPDIVKTEVPDSVLFHVNKNHR